MPHVEYLNGLVPFPVNPDAPASFASPPRLAKLTAPGALVRFVAINQRPPPPPVVTISPYAGEFWFDANLLQFVRKQAYDELTQQRRVAGQPMRNTLADLVGLYLRLYLRPSLAVRKDWKEDFEAYVTLELRAGEALHALVGPIAEQPYYSPGQAEHPQAKAAGVQLQGGVTQYYVNFNYPPNLALAPRISRPVRF